MLRYNNRNSRRVGGMRIVGRGRRRRRRRAGGRRLIGQGYYDAGISGGYDSGGGIPGMVSRPDVVAPYAYDPQIAEVVGEDPRTGHPVVVDPTSGNPVENLLNFTALAVPAAGSVNIIASPQVDFRADKLKVPRSVGPSFTIDDIKVGTRTLFAAVGGASAEIFAEDSTDANISAFTATTSMEVTLTVTNISGVAADFRASMMGRALA